MIKNIFFLGISLITSFSNAQVDLDRCHVSQKQNFSVNILKFTDSLFLQQSYNISTLYITKNDGSGKITTLNGSPLGIKFVAVDALQKHIAIVDFDNSVKIIDLSTKAIIKQFNSNNTLITALTWCNGKVILGFKDGSIVVCYLDTTKSYSLKAHSDAIISLKSFEGSILSISHDKQLKQLKFENKLQVLKGVNLKKIPTTFDISSEGDKMAVGTFNGSLIIINLRSFTILKDFKVHENIITKVKFFDSQRVITSSFDKTMGICNVNTSKTKELLNYKDYIMNFDFNKHKFIYSCRDGALVYINLDCNSNQLFLKTITNFK